MPISHLWILASAVTYPLTAGSQGVITIETLGGSWETNRRCRVARAHGPQQEEDDSISWEGTVSEWCGAVLEAANRPAFPGAIEGWTPGPYEAEFLQATEREYDERQRAIRADEMAAEDAYEQACRERLAGEQWDREQAERRA